MFSISFGNISKILNCLLYIFKNIMTLSIHKLHSKFKACFIYKLEYTFVSNYHTFRKHVFTVLFFFILLILGIYGTTKVKDGLDLTDVVPKGTTEYSFLETQSKYFGFYNIYLVTKGGFDYPNNQNLLYEYHRAFQSVGNIIKREDGSMPTFWLSQFRQWLQGLQKEN
ncbi:hypothetical protein KUTeg_016663 [Tegillarca granosa]|uniref:Uncharacterized protein n=1 Tax=Tegillarca granosa TaxID=220873 RepID=A0ABQ9ES64_TEGGR|nr:hypothetical protein KUTeg_016663 [Tegillarca granosa]